MYIEYRFLKISDPQLVEIDSAEVLHELQTHKDINKFIPVNDFLNDRRFLVNISNIVSIRQFDLDNIIDVHYIYSRTLSMLHYIENNLIDTEDQYSQLVELVGNQSLQNTLNLRVKALQYRCDTLFDIITNACRR